MPDNIVVPAWVWGLVVKLVMGTILGVGVVVVAIFWKTGRLPYGQRSPGPIPDKDRRKNDPVILQFLDAYRQGISMGAQIVTSVADLTASIREQTKAMNEGFRDLHRKVEDISNGRGNAHGHH